MQPDNMDIQIPQHEIKKRKMRCFLVWGAAVLAGTAIVALLFPLTGKSVKRSDLAFGTVGKGRIESTVSASGRVASALEEKINSPIPTRIVEVYHHEGETLEEGVPLLRLDLQSSESELGKLRDECTKRRVAVDKMRLTHRTSLSHLEMQAKVKEMETARLQAELENERYLDSLGSGTGDRVRQVELALKTGLLELAQLRTQLDNERRVNEAELRELQLDLAILEKDLDEMSRKMTDARVLIPRNGTLTYINRNIGQQIAQGEHIATIADLSRFGVNGEMSEAYAANVPVGARAVVVVGKTELEGTVATVAPTSKNGTVALTVALDDDSNTALRPGVKADIHIKGTVLDDVVTVPNGSYYTGPGTYEMFVADGDRITRRTVVLGESSWQAVEVKSGLQPGETAVTTDMKEYASSRSLKLKD